MSWAPPTPPKPASFIIVAPHFEQKQKISPRRSWNEHENYVNYSSYFPSSSGTKFISHEKTAQKGHKFPIFCSTLPIKLPSVLIFLWSSTSPPPPQPSQHALDILRKHLKLTNKRENAFSRAPENWKNEICHQAKNWIFQHPHNDERVSTMPRGVEWSEVKSVDLFLRHDTLDNLPSIDITTKEWNRNWFLSVFRRCCCRRIIRRRE